MSLQADINWIQAELSKVTDPELISAFKNLLNYRNKQVENDWWNEISKTEKNEINQGISDIKDNNTISHEEVMTNPRKWL